MEKIPIRNLQILNEVSKDHPVTQRELAKNLGMALGLANTYLKRLVRKGFIMIKTMPGNRIIYNVTPTGITEKAQLTYEYMKYSLEYYKNIRKSFRDAFKKIERNNQKNIVFYGAGEVAEIAYVSMNGLNLNLLFLVDDYKHGIRFLDKQVYPTEKLMHVDFDKLVITAFSSKETICDKILKNKIPKEKTVII